MGLFKKLKKGLGSVLKVAKVTAPIWSSFIPGGSIATSLISGAAGGGKLGKVANIARQGITAAKRLQSLKSAPRGGPGLPSWNARQATIDGPRAHAYRKHAGAARRMQTSRGRAYHGGIGTAAMYRRKAALQPRAVYLGNRRAYR